MNWLANLRSKIHAVLIGLTGALCSCAPASAEPVFTGLGQSQDGDSLMVGNREVRLYGVDAPEWNQSCKRGGQEWPCGQDAAEQLSTLVTGKQVSCTATGTDQHNRILARCRVGGVDVNRTMVALGYAVAYRHYSLDYVSTEDSARASKLGMWAGMFEMPSEYRHAKRNERPTRPERPARIALRRNSANTAPYRSGCTIKGNQGPNGWIYHLPGMPYYAQTRAEQIFCTEAAARAAGYRRAIVR